MIAPTPGRLFRSLGNPNFRLWAAGALPSNIGTWMQRTAQDWLVLTELTHRNATAVGVVMALQFGPQMLLLPWTGPAADRCDRRRLLMLTQALLGGLALGLGLLTVLGLVRLWQVDAFAFLFGCVSAFDAPARQAFVSDLVEDAILPNAVALNSTSFNAARMIGPAAAGLCIAAVGTGWAFLINGLSFAATLIALTRMRPASLPRAPGPDRAHAGLGEALRYVWRRADLRTMLVMLFLIGTFGLNFPIYISTMAVSVFHVGADRYGLLSSCMAVGTIAGALLAASRDRPHFSGLARGAALFGGGCALAALAPGYWSFGAMLVLIGLAVLALTTGTNSLMQLSTDPALRGRVMALRLAITLGGTPIGAPIVGWVADRFGPRWALGVGAVSGCAAALAALHYLWVRRSSCPPGSDRVGP
jgi:MFS family permease